MRRHLLPQLLFQSPQDLDFALYLHKLSTQQLADGRAGIALVAP